MLANRKFRKLTTALLSLALVVWASATLAVPMEAPALQCTMSAHEMMEMSDMPCCPDEAQAPATPLHAPCCEVSQAPERPVAFVATAEPSKVKVLDVVAVLPVAPPVPAAEHFGAPGSVASPHYVKPVLELKTDLRI